MNDNQRPVGTGNKALAWCVLLPCLLVIAFALTDAAEGYRGTPFPDGVYHGGQQQIPGRVQCAYYDLGGEGVAYHDTDAKNKGSGTLNPADGSYLNEFRMHEGVDISYTKISAILMRIHYEVAHPPKDQL